MTTRYRRVERSKAKQDDGEHNPRRISSLLFPSRIVHGGRGGRESSGFVHDAIVVEESITSRGVYSLWCVRSFVLVTFEETRNVYICEDIVVCLLAFAYNWNNRTDNIRWSIDRWTQYFDRTVESCRNRLEHGLKEQSFNHIFNA